MTTPTPDDLNRQVAEYAKDKCMNLSRTDGFATGERGETWADVKACAKLPTPETPLADRVRTIVFAFNRADTRRDAVRKLADDVAQLERERDEQSDLVRRAITAARPNRTTDAPRWVAVMDTFGLGSASATKLCEKCGFDPHEKVRGIPCHCEEEK